MKKEWLVKTLALGIIVLFVGAGVVSAFNINPEDKSKPLNLGNWLYVGGNGTGNYTSIQDAINDSIDGDTVFVYDDSSPYYENIVVKKSITIQGENKYTTIIDGANKSHGVNIIADSVTVTGFTIQNCSNIKLFPYISGILLSSNNNKIMDNILLQNKYGISNIINFNYFPMNMDNTVTNNQIINNHCGIFFVNMSNVIISRNIISQNDEGIMLTGAINTNISFNIVSQNGVGILLVYSYNTVIYRNNITNNNGAVATFITSGDKILQNNFISNNKLSAVSSQGFLRNIIFYMYLKLVLEVPIRRNVWDGNYWNESRSLPYIIPGWFCLRFWVDWHPAQEPYDI